MEGPPVLLQRIANAYLRVLEIFIIILITALLFAVALQVLGRYVPFIPRYLWTVEVSNVSLTWVIFTGAAIGVKESRHFVVDFLPDSIPNFIQIASRVTYYILMYVVTTVFIVYGFRFFLMGYVQESQVTGLNLGVVYASVPVSGLSWLLFVTDNLITEIRGGTSK